MPPVPPVPFPQPSLAAAVQAPPGPLELLVTYLPMAMILPGVMLIVAGLFAVRVVAGDRATSR